MFFYLLQAFIQLRASCAALIQGHSFCFRRGPWILIQSLANSKGAAALAYKVRTAQSNLLGKLLKDIFPGNNYQGTNLPLGAICPLDKFAKEDVFPGRHLSQGHIYPSETSSLVDKCRWETYVPRSYIKGRPIIWSLKHGHYEPSVPKEKLGHKNYVKHQFKRKSQDT